MHLLNSCPPIPLLLFLSPSLSPLVLWLNIKGSFVAVVRTAISPLAIRLSQQAPSSLVLVSFRRYLLAYYSGRSRPPRPAFIYLQLPLGSQNTKAIWALQSHSQGSRPTLPSPDTAPPTQPQQWVWAATSRPAAARTMRLLAMPPPTKGIATTIRPRRLRSLPLTLETTWSSSLPLPDTTLARSPAAPATQLLPIRAPSC